MAETLFVFAISIALLYIKPGPNQAIKITKALHEGFLPAWFFTLGATCMAATYFVIAGLGAEIIQNFIRDAGLYFKIIGGTYLIYLGYKGFLNIERGVWKRPVQPSSSRKGLLGSFALGVIVTMGNPITIFYFVSIMPTFMTFDAFALTDIVIGVCILFFVGNIADILLIALVTEAKEALATPKFVRRINIFASTGFIMIGAFFLYSAIINY